MVRRGWLTFLTDRSIESSAEDNSTDTMIYGWGLRALHVNGVYHHPPYLEGSLWIITLEDEDPNSTICPAPRTDHTGIARKLFYHFIEEGVVNHTEIPSSLRRLVAYESDHSSEDGSESSDENDLDSSHDDDADGSVDDDLDGADSSNGEPRSGSCGSEESDSDKNVGAEDKKLPVVADARQIE